MSVHRMLLVALVLSSACSKEPRSTESAVPFGPPVPPTAAAPGGPLAGAAAGPSFAGTFQGDIQGTPSTLTTHVHADQLSGGINAGGYVYKFTGTVAGARATGTMTDPQTGASMQFVATLNGSALQFSISDAKGTQLDMAFQRAGSDAAPVATAPSAAAAPAPAMPSGGAPAANVERDPRLIGSWRYREQLGDTRTGSMLIRWFLHIRPDGTFTYGNERSQHDGHWQTKDGIVYVNDGSGWEAYAKYSLGPQGMLFTFGNGSRRLFKRG